VLVAHIVGIDLDCNIVAVAVMFGLHLAADCKQPLLAVDSVDAVDSIVPIVFVYRRLTFLMRTISLRFE
jgi:hypothetical protein